MTMYSATLAIGTTIHLPVGALVAVFDPTSSYDPTFRRLLFASSAVLASSVRVGTEDAVIGRDLAAAGARVMTYDDALVTSVSGSDSMKVEDTGDGGNLTTDATTQLLVQSGTEIVVGAAAPPPAVDCGEGMVRNAAGECVAAPGGGPPPVVGALPWYKTKTFYVISGVTLLATATSIYLIVRSKRNK
jgi:hypothetical protein